MSAPVRPLWGYLASALLGIGALAATVAAPFLTPPRPGRPAGIVFWPGSTPGAALAAVLEADAGARLVDMRWSGTLLYVDYANVDFPETMRRHGAMHLFDAVAAGCHAAKPDR